MNGTIPPLPNTPSWRGAYLKYRDFTILPNRFVPLLWQFFLIPNKITVDLRQYCTR